MPINGILERVFKFSYGLSIQNSHFESPSFLSEEFILVSA